MRQIIEELKNEVGPVRFSILSENKIQLEYKVPITSQGSIVSEIKMKFRYRKMNDIWSLIPIRERFINQLSVTYGIKKKNIKYKYLEKEFNNTLNLDLNVDDKNYKIRSLFKSFIFDDIKWHRERLLNFLIDK